MANDSFDLHAQIDAALGAIKKEMNDIGGPNSPETKAAGRVILRSIRKTLNTRAQLYAGPLKAGAKQRGIPSAPGAPPHRITGRLYKSERMEVVGGVLRIGSNYFVSRLLEGGVDATAPLKSGKVRKRKGNKARRKIVIAARPFMDRAINAVADQVGDEFALVVQKRIEGGVSNV